MPKLQLLEGDLVLGGWYMEQNFQVKENMEFKQRRSFSTTHRYSMNRPGEDEHFEGS